MKVNIEKSKIFGKVSAPPSKSLAHRYLICAGLAEGESTVNNISMSNDIAATLDCLKALGADWKYDGYSVKIKGIGGRIKRTDTVLDCRECGSTLRFFIPICMMNEEAMSLTGTAKLLSRPLGVYDDLSKEKGIAYEQTPEKVTVGGPIMSGRYTIRGDVSSQFISGLLFVLPLLEGDSVIDITEPVESRPYIELTLDVLKQYGVEVSWENDHVLAVKGGQSYKTGHYMVEGDWSNAAFFYALKSLHGALPADESGKMEIFGLREDSLQGDKAARELIPALMKGFIEADIKDCPDLGPILFAVAAASKGAHFTGTERLRIKESDRCQAMADELEKFGVKMEINSNDVTVNPVELAPPTAVLSGHNDHRIVMSMAVLLSLTGGTIEGAEAVNKSFPDFFEAMESLGVKVEYAN